MLLEHCAEPVMSVGRLAEIVADLESGKLKIRRCGQAAIEKIKDGFDKFWANQKVLDTIGWNKTKNESQDSK